jgi:acetyl-CoA acetyltransferase
MRWNLQLVQVELFAQARDCLLPMGLTSENVAQRFGITRLEQDQAAVSWLIVLFVARV